MEAFLPGVLDVFLLTLDASLFLAMYANFWGEPRNLHTASELLSGWSMCSMRFMHGGSLHVCVSVYVDVCGHAYVSMLFVCSGNAYVSMLFVHMFRSYVCVNATQETNMSWCVSVLLKRRTDAWAQSVRTHRNCHRKQRIITHGSRYPMCEKKYTRRCLFESREPLYFRRGAHEF
jgi:hypothetical protein